MNVCPFCPSGKTVRVCRCPDAQYAQVVGLPAASEAFRRRGGVLRGETVIDIPPTGPAPDLAIAELLQSDDMVAQVDAFRARLAQPSQDKSIVIVLPPWSTVVDRETTLRLARTVLFGGDDGRDQVEAGDRVDSGGVRGPEQADHGAPGGQASNLNGAASGGGAPGDDGPAATAPVQFVLNDDGTAPFQQPRGICPSCDVRHAHFDSMRKGREAKRKLSPGDT